MEMTYISALQTMNQKVGIEEFREKIWNMDDLSSDEMFA